MFLPLRNKDGLDVIEIINKLTTSCLSERDNGSDHSIIVIQRVRVYSATKYETIEQALSQFGSNHIDFCYQR